MWDRATEPYPDLTSGELPKTEAPLEDVLAPPQLVESLVSGLVSPSRRSPRSTS